MSFSKVAVLGKEQALAAVPKECQGLTRHQVLQRQYGAVRRARARRREQL
jgi:hypothetical protein